MNSQIKQWNEKQINKINKFYSKCVPLNDYYLYVRVCVSVREGERESIVVVITIVVSLVRVINLETLAFQK